nr:ROK family protein [uncultured Brevundimonas sp.]
MSTYAGIEIGGTKTLVGFGHGPDDLGDVIRIETTTPEATMATVGEALRARDRSDGLKGIGVASFGPVRVASDAPDHGRILRTPKAGWSGADLLGPLRAFDVPIGLATDVGGAALAEGRWGACMGIDDHVYVTVGTGVGMGIVANGRLVHGALHPEAGHMSVRTAATSDTFAGVCPFHGDCLEGLVCGPAIASRLGRPAESADPDDPIWDIVAGHLAQMAANLTYVLSPRRIVIGGGVGGADHLLERVRTALAVRLGGYLPHLVDDDDLRQYLQQPRLGAYSGVLGALILAQGDQSPSGRSPQS